MIKRIFAASLILSSATALADPVDISGYVGIEVNHFDQIGLYPGQLTHTQPSLVFAPELRWRSDDGDTRANLSLFGRLDAADTDRSHFDIREAYVQHSYDTVSVLLGVNKVFWGVTESRHLVDIINQVDQLEYTDTDARLGQPMLSVTTDQDWGTLSAFVMTGFRELDFAGSEGRLRFGLPVDTASTSWGNSDEEWAPDFALRYANTFGAVDLGFSAFHGTSREPILQLNGGGTALEPYYGRIWQAGLDAQYTGDAVLLKLEAIMRGSDDFETFGAVVAGLEYTLYQVAGSDGDLGLIAEYLHDERGADAPTTINQDDIFIGARWAANDERDTSALIGAIYDNDDSSTALRAEFERRLDIGLSLKLRAQAFTNTDASNPLHAFRTDDYVSIALEKHF